MWEYFAPFRARRDELAADLGQVRAILKMGAERPAPWPPPPWRPCAAKWA